MKSPTSETFKAKCVLCGGIIETKDRHKIVYCTCGSIAVFRILSSGGSDFWRWCAKNPKDFIYLSPGRIPSVHPMEKTKL